MFAPGEWGQLLFAGPHHEEMKRMALIADLCPNCHQVTRCHVVERGGAVGGLILGVPFVLPTSSVSCCCGECGCEFVSQTWDHQKSLSPGEAKSLDIEAILSLTNPALKEQVTLLRLKGVPELGGAFQLLEELKPGTLRTALKDSLVQWPSLDEDVRERFLADANGCAESLRFARHQAGRFRTGVVGCLGGILGCAGVWSGCVVAFGTQLSVWGWIGIFGAGVMAGSLLSALLWSGRNRRWLSAVLIPEADQAGIRLGWLLAVLEGSAPSKVGDDDLASLRELAPALRAELAASGKAVDEAGFAFRALPGSSPGR
jgi:hypothetical protein